VRETLEGVLEGAAGLVLLLLLLRRTTAEAPAEVGTGCCVDAAVLELERIVRVEVLGLLLVPTTAEEVRDEDKPAGMEDAVFGLVVLMLMPGWLIWLLLPGAIAALLEAEVAMFAEGFMTMLDASVLGTSAQTP